MSCEKAPPDIRSAVQRTPKTDSERLQLIAVIANDLPAGTLAGQIVRKLASDPYCTLTAEQQEFVCRHVSRDSA